MRKIVLLLCALCVSQLTCAISDIGYSNDTGGYWAYTPSQVAGEGVFTFVQPIGVDDVQGAATDSLVNGFLYIPDLRVTNLTEVFPGMGIYTGLLTPVTSTIALKDSLGADILTGTLTSGGVFTVGSSASMYPTFSVDITITDLPNAINSQFIDSLQVGWGFNFDLTLQDSSINLAQVIQNNQAVTQGGTLSGSMTTIIPEPATLAMLGLGCLLLRKRR